MRARGRLPCVRNSPLLMTRACSRSFAAAHRIADGSRGSREERRGVSEWAGIHPTRKHPYRPLPPGMRSHTSFDRIHRRARIPSCIVAVEVCKRKTRRRRRRIGPRRRRNTLRTCTCCRPNRRTFYRLEAEDTTLPCTPIARARCTCRCCNRRLPSSFRRACRPDTLSAYRPIAHCRKRTYCTDQLWFRPVGRRQRRQSRIFRRAQRWCFPGPPNTRCHTSFGRIRRPARIRACTLVAATCRFPSHRRRHTFARRYKRNIVPVGTLCPAGRRTGRPPAAGRHCLPREQRRRRPSSTETEPRPSSEKSSSYRHQRRTHASTIHAKPR